MHIFDIYCRICLKIRKIAGQISYPKTKRVKHGSGRFTFVERFGFAIIRVILKL